MENKRKCTETELKLIKGCIIKELFIDQWSEEELNSFYITNLDKLYYRDEIFGIRESLWTFWVREQFNFTFKKPINEEIKNEETEGDKTMIPLTNKQKVKLILENFTDEDGNINLTNLDFGDRFVYLSFMKAKRIYNDEQEAEMIDNDGQEAETIRSDDQVILPRYSRKSKEELIKIILELEKEK